MQDSQILEQSKSAYKQWSKQWREYAKYNSKNEMKDLLHFQNSGIGKAALLIANGYSFEENLDVIRENRSKVDIFCVDKSLIHCLENGIVPDFCLVCDANVSYEKYLEPVKDRLQDTVLAINVCANPKWADNGNWKDKYFFVNKDVLKSEKEFSELSGCKNIIPAATNVSNALIVFLTQCDERGANNYFGYDKILLIGYDYSWTNKSYYAFDKDGGGKSNYMKMIYLPNLDGRICFTSNNLLFSAKWVDKYIKTFNLNVFQCSKSSILTGKRILNLKEQLQYQYKPEDAKFIQQAEKDRREAFAKIDRINKMIFNIGRDHYKQVIRTT